MGDIKNQAPLFIVIFEDETSFCGGFSYEKTLWKEIPNKKIKRIFYRLPDGNHLCLEGYDFYFHMIEATVDWAKLTNKGLTKLENKQQIEFAYIMGKKDNNVTSYRITLYQTKDGRYKIGDILRRDFDINSDKIKGLNQSFWKPLI